MITVEKPTLLDHVLSYSPIPILGERATWKIALYTEQDREERLGRNFSGWERFTHRFFTMKIHRGLGYFVPLTLFLHSCEDQIKPALEYLLK